MGAPGSYYWTGTIKVYNLTSDSLYSPNKENVDSHRYSYLGKNQLTTSDVVNQNCQRGCGWLLSLLLGYAVSAGHFSSPNVIDVAAGAPQHNGSGKVGTSSSVLCQACELRSSRVALFSDLFSSRTGLHFQNRGCLFGEDFPSLRENGMSLDGNSHSS